MARRIANGQKYRILKDFIGVYNDMSWKNHHSPRGGALQKIIKQVEENVSARKGVVLCVVRSALPQLFAEQQNIETSRPRRKQGAAKPLGRHHRA